MSTLPSDRPIPTQPRPASGDVASGDGASGDGSPSISLPVLSAELIASVNDGPKRTTSLYGRRTPLSTPEAQFAALDGVRLDLGPTETGSFHRDLVASGWEQGIDAAPIEIFQINIGKLCNMTCMHCHVDSGPDRVQENMDRQAVDACLHAIDHILAHPQGSTLHTIDLTGGAPELNPHFEYLVDECVARGLHVIDRCNLTILKVKRYRHLPEWFAARGVEVACSLPHYRKMGTDAQRGDGTYEKSIEALRALNAAGYGQGDPKRMLTLVTNPVGSFLAGSQESLEGEWKEALERNHGVQFDRLFALNNMPMSRYLEWLVGKGQLDAYMERLLAAYNPGTIDGLMCRNTISVGWDGKIYDCDFNQQLEMDAAVPFGHVGDFDLGAWQARTVRTARHCYGCTAGAGSSCGGATA